MQIYLHLGMGFSVRRQGGAWQPASFIAHAWSILWRNDAGRVFWKKNAGRVFWKKTQAVCSSLGGLQGGDDEATESGTEMGVLLGAGIGGGRFGVLGRRGMAAEMLAVVRITLFPLGTQGGVFQNG